MKIEVERFGTPPDKVVRDIKFEFAAVNESLVVLGQQTADQMRNIIKTSKHRPAGSRDNLERSIDVYVEEEPNRFTVGIGKISVLNQFAPYWEMINYGGVIPGGGKAVYGSFEGDRPDHSKAGTGVGTQSFFKSVYGNITNDNTFYMKPRNPVWAMNYIQRTDNWLSNVWAIHFSGATNKFKIKVRS